MDSFAGRVVVADRIAIDGRVEDDAVAVRAVETVDHVVVAA